MKVLSIVIFTITIFYGNIIDFDNYQANFLQIVKNSSNNIIKYTGEIFIDKNSHILWRYKTPVEKNIYIDNKMVIIDEPELEQAILSPLKNELNLFDLINSSKKIDNNLYQNKVDGIVYTIVIKNNNLISIKYKDNIDNYITIKFFDQKDNVTFKKDFFKFTTPPYYDVIRK